MAIGISLNHFIESFLWKWRFAEKTACCRSVDEQATGFLNEFFDILLTWPVLVKSFVFVDPDQLMSQENGDVILDRDIMELHVAMNDIRSLEAIANRSF